MGIPKKLIICLFLATAMAIQTTTALTPYTRTSLWDLMLPPDDPFRILEQTPLSSPKSIETLALARCDWKETPTSHVITLDVPGLTKEDIKIEVEENRVLRIGGERKEEKEIEGERWHRFERISGKFWRQFRLPEHADLERVKAHLENGVLRIEVPKVAAEEKKRKVVDIAEERRDGGEDIKAMKKDEM
ncbi:unnamed protein product [Camellia sinensis]